MENEKSLKAHLFFIPAGHNFIVKADDPSFCDELRINLISGSAEVYGVDIKKYFPHSFQMPCVLPVFSWDSAEIRIQWKEEKLGKAADSWVDLGKSLSMPKYLELHYELTCLRKMALETGQRGPRVAVIGGESSGSAYVTRLLLNYAGKLNMRALFVDLNLDSSIFIDGTIGATTFEYKQNEESQTQEKLLFCYGNRRIKSKSFLQHARLISEAVNCRVDVALKDYVEKGSMEESPMFSVGIIVHCPSFNEKDDRKLQREILYEILRNFKISHIVIVNNSEMSNQLAEQFPKIERISTEKIEGIDDVLRLKNKTKVQRQLGNEPELVVVRIDEVRLYEFIELEHGQLYCRQMDVKGELINKTTISILHAFNDASLDKYQIAERVANSPIRCIARIAKITNEEMTLQVGTENFWEDCRDRIWISMVSEVQHN